jgi:host factor-I protein
MAACTDGTFGDEAGAISATNPARAASHKKTMMTPPLTHLRRSRTPPPGDTGQEALYLRSLSDRQVSVQVQLRDGETIDGWIEYFDDGMIRITRDGHPNLFIYKHQIRTITELTRRRLSRRAGNAGMGL